MRSRLLRSQRQQSINVPMRLSLQCEYEQLQSMCLDDDATLDIEVDQLDAGEQHEDDIRPVEKYVLKPTSKLRMVLDLASLCVLSYDLITTPYIIAWQVDWEGWLQVATYFTLIFWTMDIGISFRTGYWDSHGQLECSPVAIAAHYLRTFFIIDVSAVASDLSTVIINTANSGEGSAEALRFSKAARLLRLLGIMRISRLEGIYARLCDRYPRLRGTGIMLSIFKILLLILYINHMIACGWYALGSQIEGSDTGSVWLEISSTSPALQDSDGNVVKYHDAGFAYQYFTAFHFSLTQMTPGSMQVFPVNTYERIYNGSCLIFGLLFFSTLVSSLSSKLMQQKLRYEEHHRTFGTLYRFLRESKVSRKLAISVEQEAKSRMNQASILSYCNVSALKFLSPAMRAELKYGICRGQLVHIPFFRISVHMKPEAVRALCRDFVDFKVVVQADHVFESLKPAECIYTLVKGGLEYATEKQWECASSDASMNLGKKISCDTPLRGASRKTNGTFASTTVVTPPAPQPPTESWLAEAALWSHWQHAGTAKATESGSESGASMMSLQVSGFVEIIKNEPLLQELAWEYTQQFHRRMSMMATQAGADMDDMQLGSATYEDVVLMTQDVVRIFLSLVCVSMLKSSSHKALTLKKSWSLITGERLHSIAQLEKEVREKKCTLTVTEGGRVQRVTAVAVVQVTRPNGRIWVQLAKIRENEVSTNVALPGMKMQDGGDLSEAFEYVKARQLSFMADHISPTNVLKKVKSDWSDSYGIYTKYIRHIQQATIDDQHLEPQDGSLLRMVVDGIRTQSQVSSVQSGARPGIPTWAPSISLTSEAKSAASTNSNSHAFTPVTSSGKSVSGMVDEIYFTTDGDKTVFVSAWLSMEEFDYMASPSGSALLRRWFEKPYVDQGLREAGESALRGSKLQSGSLAGDLPWARPNTATSVGLT
eukprot:CAMPEP_0178375138 /NCGR_PEP_ID=MMETSP0689_2-20121128/2733_1 /TAXON_ID=160604 /ORGANISM="Amphidinium massartii, Strain CS-259" /LENGTH=937 /DNA_ID=CAMNT_0019995121 /DNA_START=1 /DNA_END=2811 /DNA_ORIENTATION=-